MHGERMFTKCLFYSSFIIGDQMLVAIENPFSMAC